MLRKSLVFVLLLLAGVLPAAAQRVGVVMSGGGAKGLYHIGVLEALEQNGVPHYPRIQYGSGPTGRIHQERFPQIKEQQYRACSRKRINRRCDALCRTREKRVSPV